MKYLTLILFVLIFACSERSKITNPDDNPGLFTEVQGYISGDLSIKDSPYLVVGDIIVDSSQLLNIDPGVSMYFTDTAKVIVYGQLSATGNISNLITFSAYDNHWKGIRIESSSQVSYFRYSIIEKVSLSYEDSTELGALQINYSRGNITKCVFKENIAISGAAVSVFNSEAVISNNIFRENEALVHGGGILCYASQSKIINNTFYENYSVNCGAAISLLIPVNDIVQNNIMFNNLSQGICEQFYYNNLDSLNYSIDYNFVSQNDPDPKFIPNTELRLFSDSPCIDAGNPDSRYNDTDGSRNDQGAYGGPDGT